MRQPRALLPLRHRSYRTLWFASLITALGTWLQNTGAGWLMTSLAPDALTVSLVQAATILPVFLLALPAGALADMVDRRLFLIGTQLWTILAASILAGLTLAHLTGVWSLLGLTFVIGVGSAMTFPAWGAIVPELVPRDDLVQAIALNGIGFNLARTIGPALAGMLIGLAGSGVAFTLYAVSILAVIAALILWRREKEANPLPREHLLSAIRAGIRFVRNTPPMQAAMVRSFAYSLPAAAPWALLPLVVREQLGLGASMYGLILGVMGAGGVAAGLSLPGLRRYADRGAIVVISSLFSCAGTALLGLSRHWLAAGIGMLVFGMGWVSAFASMQAAAQLAAPAWVRARALAIYQLSFNGAVTAGSFGWGWLGTEIGLPNTLIAAAASGLVLALLVRHYSLDAQPIATAPAGPPPLLPATAIVPERQVGGGRVLEAVRYTIDPADRTTFLEAMAEVRLVRGRAGALAWQLYEDLAQPDLWVELWWMENWTDHLREAARLSEEDRVVLMRAARCHRGRDGPPLARYLAVAPAGGPASPRRPSEGSKLLAKS
ncbi:MAG: MFS transporter [Alphaproteobacteria bacterium]|nr:MFS transporter [Alphaproteobacteria bacterium]